MQVATRPHWPTVAVVALCILPVSLGALALARTPTEEGPQGKVVVIGMSAAFTGPSRGLGIEFYRGAMAYFTEVNRLGGVHGHRLVLKAYDDGYNPGPAVENTRRLIQRDRALLLFGYVGTPTTTRVLPLLKRFEKERVLLFCPFTGAGPMRQGPYAPLVFNLRASYQDETAGLVDGLVKMGKKRIFVFYQIDAYGRSGWDGVRKALARHGLKMCGEATYRRGAGFDVSMRRQAEIVRERQADAVVCVGAYAACAAFIRDVRDAGWSGPIANVSFVGSENLLAHLHAHGKASAGGRDYTSGLVSSQVVPSPTQTDLPGVKLYDDLMRRHAPKGPPAYPEADYEPLPRSYTSLEGLLGARLVVEALRRLGPGLQRERLREAAESKDGFDLGLGEGSRVRFTAARHQGLSEVYFTVTQGGRFVPLTAWERWRP